jgi:hypothetical protein
MEIINAIHASTEMMDDVKFLVQPIARFHVMTEPIEHAAEVNSDRLIRYVLLTMPRRS